MGYFTPLGTDLWDAKMASHFFAKIRQKSTAKESVIIYNKNVKKKQRSRYKWIKWLNPLELYTHTHTPGKSRKNIKRMNIEIKTYKI